MSLPDTKESVQCTLHGVEYLLSVSTFSKDELLVVEVEQCEDLLRWKGEFSQRYVEEITAKTGNFKKHHVFVKMLISALKGASGSVFIDLLTHEDLEALKAQMTRNTGASPQYPKIPKNNKRYLILTYSSEFDRVHYPLPLAFEENPDVDRLKEIIKDLRMRLSGLSQDQMGNADAEINGHAHLNADCIALKEENKLLKQQLEEFYKEGVSADRKEAREAIREMHLALKERDLVLKRAEAAEADLEHERGLHRREIRRQNRELQDLGNELSKSHRELRELRAKVREVKRNSGAPLPSNPRLVQRTTHSNRIVRPPMDRKVSPARSKGSTPSLGSNRTSNRTASLANSEASQSSCDNRSTRLPARSSPTLSRFDPTQYVLKKRERERAIAQRKQQRSPGFGSGRSSSPDSRSSSLRRRRPLIPSSVTNRLQSPSKSNKSFHIGSDRCPQQEKTTINRKQRMHSMKPSPRVKLPSPRAPPIHSSADESELSHKKQTLPDLTAATQQQMEDGHADLADVDSRLQALQDFLRMAKESASGQCT